MVTIPEWAVFRLGLEISWSVEYLSLATSLKEIHWTLQLRSPGTNLRGSLCTTAQTNVYYISRYNNTLDIFSTFKNQIQMLQKSKSFCWNLIEKAQLLRLQTFHYTGWPTGYIPPEFFSGYELLSKLCHMLFLGNLKYFITRGSWKFQPSTPKSLKVSWKI